LLYADETMDLQAEIAGLTHEGRARLDGGDFQLNTSTQAATVDLTYEKIPYLSKVVADVRSDLWIEPATQTYRFMNTAIRLNELDLLTDGFFQLPDDTSYRMDIRFASPSKDFRQLLSMIPAVYAKDFRDVKAGGSFSLHGWVKGTYASQQLPAYELNLGVQEGFFKYPQLPEAVRDISLSLSLKNPDGHEDSLLVDLSRAHFLFGQDPVDMKLIFHHPLSHQYLDAMVKGRLDLQKVQRFIPLSPGTSLAGTVDADLFASGRMAGMENEDASFRAGGRLDVEGLSYTAKDIPAPIRNGRMQVSVRNENGVADHTNISISGGHLEIGTDPLDFEILVSRPMTDINANGWLKTEMNLANLMAYTKQGPDVKLSGKMAADVHFDGSRKAYAEKRFDEIRVEGDLRVDDLRYVSKDYPEGVRVSRARMGFSNRAMDLLEFEAGHKGTLVQVKGRVEHFIGYALEKETLKGALTVKADKVMLNDWIGTETGTGEDSVNSTVFLVPARIDLQLDASADELVYDKVSYANLRGTLIVRDEQVILEEVRMEALDGSITMNGRYDTRDANGHPAVAMEYRMTNMDIQKTFYAYNTVQKLMPVGQFISGRMHSTMKLSGLLGKDMMPDLSTLEGQGSLFLVDGVLKKFAPVEKLASELGVSGLGDITLRDIKNYVRVSQGKVLVKPFHVNLGGIETDIGGTQGIDQVMDYLLVMQVPRAMMGEKGNALMNRLSSEAGAKGIPVSLGETVPLNARIGGTIQKPTIHIDFRQSAKGAADAFKAQAGAFVEQKKDSLRQVAYATGNALKDSAKLIRDQAVQGYKSDLIRTLKGEADSNAGKTATTDRVKESSGEAVKGVLNGLLKKKKSGS
ncbi:MAG: AsmA-like C-terminal region-containing protein, partial [Chitinophagaceae bacterium]|nr:AsmA-like C-terminal region-containing protein [Chitinophagaceae bacterium]